jgi:hypothetical protein
MRTRSENCAQDCGRENEKERARARERARERASERAKRAGEREERMSQRRKERESESKRERERARDACSSRLLIRAGSLLITGLYGKHARSPPSGASAPPHAAAEAPACPVEFDRLKFPEGDTVRPGDRAPAVEGVGERTPRFPTPATAIAALDDRRSSPRRLEARRSSPSGRESAGSGAAGGCPQV